MGSDQVDGIANFVTLDTLREQLAVIEHYLETTPQTPLNASRRYKLAEEREYLLNMILHYQSPVDLQQNHSNSESSTSLELSPRFSADHCSDNNSASISGFSTPELFSAQMVNIPFASIAEDAFVQHDDRIAQELA